MSLLLLCVRLQFRNPPLQGAGDVFFLLQRNILTKCQFDWLAFWLDWSEQASTSATVAGLVKVHFHACESAGTYEREVRPYTQNLVKAFFLLVLLKLHNSQTMRY